MTERTVANPTERADRRPRANLRNGIAARVRGALRRAIRTVELRPARAVGTATTRVNLSDGLTCEVGDGDWRLVVDMPDRWGGKDRGPNPGVFGRAALGSCMAMTYARWAADSGLPIDRLEVEIEADYDARGELGVSDATPAYTAVRAVIEVESPAPPEEVRRVFARADELCPYLKVWEDPVQVRRDVRVSAPEGA